MNFKKENLIKSPLSYTGNKFKLLPQILPLFPEDINYFYDVFGGSFTVGGNIDKGKVYYNEANGKVYELVRFLSECDLENSLLKIDNIIKLYKLDKKSKEEYTEFRKEYNQNPNPLYLFILSCFSFNAQIRFNNKGEFNMPCGDKDFNNNIRQRFIEFNNKIKNKNIVFTNKDYKNVQIYNDNTLVYLDPPYLPTIATYTENSAWNEEKELEMYEYIDWLDSQNIKFALSNVIWYRGKQNKLLTNWSKKHKVHNLNFTYKNNNRYNKDNTLYTQEVLITNY